MKSLEKLGIAFLIGAASSAAGAAEPLQAVTGVPAVPMSATEMQAVRGMKGVLVLNGNGLVNNALAQGRKDSLDKLIVVVTGGKNSKIEF